MGLALALTGVWLAAGLLAGAELNPALADSQSPQPTASPSPGSPCSPGPACSPSAHPTATPSPTASPSTSPSPSATPSPTPTPTPTPPPPPPTAAATIPPTPYVEQIDPDQSQAAIPLINVDQGITARPPGHGMPLIDYVLLGAAVCGLVALTSLFLFVRLH